MEINEKVSTLLVEMYNPRNKPRNNDETDADINFFAKTLGQSPRKFKVDMSKFKNIKR